MQIELTVNGAARSDGPVPVRAAAAEQALAGGASVADAAALAAEGTAPAVAPAGHDVPHAMAVAGTSRNAPVSY